MRILVLYEIYSGLILPVPCLVHMGDLMEE